MQYDVLITIIDVLSIGVFTVLLLAFLWMNIKKYMTPPQDVDDGTTSQVNPNEKDSQSEN